ncbi:EamA family transporter [Streptomyces longisporoflavus]|uniref:EamA family transporter n=1 Tax=Streptomyces longisporoflavus TaxID=28044 RepID=A0ABW7R0M1_9ACTN
MGAVLALASSLSYGVSDFAGGLLSRRAHFVTVAFVGQVGGLLFACVIGAFLSTGTPHLPDLVWGALSGVGTGVGMTFLFRGMSRGTISTVVPVSAVTGVALPVLVGVVLWAERPSALSWLGLAVTAPALWLVSRDERSDSHDEGGTAMTDGLIAGCGIAVQYLCLARAGDEGIWPIAAGRLAAVVTLLPLVLAHRTGSRPVPGHLVGAGVTGMAAALALVLYLQAVRQQLAVTAVALSSFYPVLPVVLGVIVLKERLRRTQLLGLVTAGVAIGLVTLG